MGSVTQKLPTTDSTTNESNQSLAVVKKRKLSESKDSKTHSRLENFGSKRVTWKAGVSPNPGGRPKKDIASEIARGVFEKNPQIIGKAMLAGLIKGNGGMARMFGVLSDRGYGKLTEHLQVDAQVSAGVADRLAAARKRVIVPRIVS